MNDKQVPSSWAQQPEQLSQNNHHRLQNQQNAWYTQNQYETQQYHNHVQTQAQPPIPPPLTPPHSQPQTQHSQQQTQHLSYIQHHQQQQASTGVYAQPSNQSAVNERVSHQQFYYNQPNQNIPIELSGYPPAQNHHHNHYNHQQQLPVPPMVPQTQVPQQLTQHPSYVQSHQTPTAVYPQPSNQSALTEQANHHSFDYNQSHRNISPHVNEYSPDQNHQHNQYNHHQQPPPLKVPPPQTPTQLSQQQTQHQSYVQHHQAPTSVYGQASNQSPPNEQNNHHQFYYNQSNNNIPSQVGDYPQDQNHYNQQQQPQPHIVTQPQGQQPRQHPSYIQHQQQQTPTVTYPQPSNQNSINERLNHHQFYYNQPNHNIPSQVNDYSPVQNQHNHYNHQQPAPPMIPHPHAQHPEQHTQHAVYIQPQQAPTGVYAQPSNQSAQNPKKNSRKRKQGMTEENQKKSAYSEFYSEKKKELFNDVKDFSEASKVISDLWNNLSHAEKSKYTQAVVKKRKELLKNKASQQAQELLS